MVTEAADGIFGMDAIRADPPDLIISDVRMPRTNGDELFASLRSKDSEIHIPFIFLSGHITDDDVISRLNHGADLCLRKPIKPSLLRAHVNSCLSKYERFTEYMTGRLDEIADSVPQDVKRDFSSYRSLADNLQRYADLVIDAVKDGHNYPNEAPNKAKTMKSSSDVKPPFSGSGAENRVAFVRLCLAEFDRRRAIVPDTGTEFLTWQLIFLVAEAQLLHKNVFVSDLYVTATSAKTTTNNRTNQLVANGVFEKRQQDSDGRRQSIVLTRKFTETLEEHIDETVHNIKILFN